MLAFHGLASTVLAHNEVIIVEKTYTEYSLHVVKFALWIWHFAKIVRAPVCMRPKLTFGACVHAGLPFLAHAADTEQSNKLPVCCRLQVT